MAIRILTYTTFIDLLSAIDEHTRCQHSREWCVRQIYEHFSTNVNGFIAYNAKGEKAFFAHSCWISQSYTNKQFKDFNKFMSCN